MTATCQDVIRALEAFAPMHYAFEGDSIGLQLGYPQQKVQKVFLALELNEAICREAREFGAHMVVVHHTPFFKPFKQLRDDLALDQVVIQLIRSEMALYCAHTNLDCAPGGVNDVLARLLGLEKTTVLESSGQSEPGVGLGRVGQLPEPITLQSLARKVSLALDTKVVRFCGGPHQTVQTVACCGGSGIFLMHQAKACHAEVLLTSDVKHHEAQQALDMGLNVIDASHYATEMPVMKTLKEYLERVLPDLTFTTSQIITEPFYTLNE